MSQVFISYKQEEREHMRPMADALRALKVDVWFDERLQPDRPFTDEIEEVIKISLAQIVCWSPLAAKSEWVLGEADKGRQRGVLIAVMIEPCDLPPPFNMYHAENLSGWKGDPRHSGWRKVVDAVGRKLGRPGLGELSALQGSEDAEGWKRWAGKYPNDLFADDAWARAEELEVTAAKARMARQRDAAKRAAEQTAALKAVQISPPATPPGGPASAEMGPTRQQGARPVLVGSIIGVLGLAAAVFMFVAARGGNDNAAPRGVQTTAVVEQKPPEAGVTMGELTALEALPTPGKQPDTVAPPLTPKGATLPKQNAEIADKKENPASLNSQAYKYYSGDGAKQDYAEAVRLYKLAADQGDAAGQNNLGFMYDMGYGVKQDYAKAVQLYKLAADQGDAEGQNNLAANYEDGHGVKQDRNEAIRLYRLAAAQGNEDAKANLKRLGVSP